MEYIIIIALVFVALFAIKLFAGDKSKGAKVLENPTIIDVRTQEEWNGGHIDGAILIPHGQIKSKIADKVNDKKTPIAVYCRSGHRAGLAQKALKDLGYENVENYGSMGSAKKLLGKK